MLAVTRKNKIKDILIERKSITVTELSKTFDVTEETIRRDLKFLEDEGFLTRTYGGAFIQSGVENNVTVELREVAYIKSKEAIANECRKLIHNGDSIFLDASTTALFVARAVSNMRLTVVTNSLLIVNQLTELDNIRVVCVGGTFSKDHKAFQGNMTIQALDNLFLDKTFMSCRSLSMEHGITDSSEGQAMIHQKLLKRSNEVYLIADYSKFDKTSFIHICDYDNLTGIVTDKVLSQEWKDFLLIKNTTFISC
jgi:DeoR/GlpR family transcriptional regulator of sugar metabolism